MTIVRVRKGVGSPIGRWLSTPLVTGFFLWVCWYFWTLCIRRLPFWRALLVSDMVALVFLVRLCQFRRVGGGRGL